MLSRRLATDPPLRHRAFGLDVVRAVAILFVLITHSALFIPISNTGPGIFKHGVLPVFGLIGVELFFGLSGYLIGQILLKRQRSLRRFYLHRLAKILPPYFLMITLIALATAAPWTIIWAHLSFTQNFDPNMAAFFPVSWSLSIEFWFYAVIPLILWRAHHPGVVIRRLVGIIGLLLIARLILATTTQPYWEFGVHRLIPLRLDAMLFGVLAAVIDTRYPRLCQRICHYRVAIINLVALVGICVWFGWMFYHYPQFEQAHLAKAVIFTLTGFMIMQLLLSAKHHLEAFARHALLSRIASWLSQISYSLYLIHLFIFSYGATMGWPVGITLPLVIMSSLAAASLMYYLFEVAIVLKLRRWLEHRWLAGT